MMLFCDEAGFCLHPKLGRVWSKKGKQPSVPDKNIFAAIPLVLGSAPFVAREEMKRELKQAETLLCLRKKDIPPGYGERWDRVRSACYFLWYRTCH